MKNFKKIIDVKSIVTLTLLITLEIITIMTFMKDNMDLIQLVFTLFSNIITMVFTYFFTKKTSDDKGNIDNNNSLYEETIKKDL